MKQTKTNTMTAAGSIKRYIAAITVLVCFAAVSSFWETVALIHANHSEHCREHGHEHGHDNGNNNRTSGNKSEHCSGCTVCAVIKTVAGSRMLFGTAPVTVKPDFQKTFAVSANINLLPSQTNHSTPILLKVRLNN